jgi:hypothetical protein
MRNRYQLVPRLACRTYGPVAVRPVVAFATLALNNCAPPMGPHARNEEALLKTS